MNLLNILNPFTGKLQKVSTPSPEIQDLQNVTDIGNSTTNEILGIDPSQDSGLTTKRYVDGLTKTRSLILDGDLKSAYSVSHYKKLIELSSLALNTPNGILITSIDVQCSVGAPATNLVAKIKGCDLQVGAFPSTGQFDIDTINTSSGVYTNNSVNYTVPIDRIVFLEMNADPLDVNTLWTIKINFNII